MRYSIEPKTIGTHLDNKYGQKLLDSAKISTTDAIKTASKRAIQKTAEVTGNLTGNKIADKKISISKSSKTNENELEIPKGKYIFPEKRQQTIDDLRLP